MARPWKGFMPFPCAGPKDNNPSTVARVVCLIFMAVSACACICTLCKRVYTPCWRACKRHPVLSFHISVSQADDLATPPGDVFICLQIGRVFGAVKIGTFVRREETQPL
jgi:hypothetical protein